MIIQGFFFKFHDFTMHGTFLVIFQVFHDFQSLCEPCYNTKTSIKEVIIHKTRGPEGPEALT